MARIPAIAAVFGRRAGDGDEHDRKLPAAERVGQARDPLHDLGSRDGRQAS
jgi:hypothetical protein